MSRSAQRGAFAPTSWCRRASRRGVQPSSALHSAVGHDGMAGGACRRAAIMLEDRMRALGGSRSPERARHANWERAQCRQSEHFLRQGPGGLTPRAATAAASSEWAPLPGYWATGLLGYWAAFLPSLRDFDAKKNKKQKTSLRAEVNGGGFVPPPSTIHGRL